jgi:hypothetical protein
MTKPLSARSAIAALLAAAVVACTSGGGGNAAWSGNQASCTAGTTGLSTACTSCLGAQCEGQLQTLQSSCAAFDACVCADGGAACHSKLDSVCTTALTSLASCESSQCSAQCGLSGADGG